MTKKRSFRLGDDAEDQDSKGERAVIKRIRNHLAAHLSRKYQADRLIADFPNDISHVRAKDNYTNISFCLRATENDKSDDEVLLSLC